jgi:hypothetical protein
MNKSEFLELNLPSRDNTTDIADINAISDNFEIIDDAFLDLVEKEIPKLQTKENMKLSFDDDSTNEEQYPSVPAVVNFTNRKVNPLKIVNSASGNAIAIKDSAKDKLVNLKLYGKTTQDGTPTPDAPKELKSVGDSGSFEVGIYRKNLFDSTQLLKASGWTESNGVYSGAHHSLNSAFGGNTSGFNIPKFKENTQYTLSFYACVNDSGIGQFTFFYTDGTTAFVRISGTEMTKYTLTSGSGKTISKVVGTYASGSATILSIKDIQLEEGTQATPYEPCNKQSITLTDTLRSVGDIADEKNFARGVKTQRINEVSGANGIYNEDGFVWVNLGTLKGVYGAEIISTHSYICSFSGASNYIKISGFSSQAEWESFVATNDIKFQYALAEPIETPISESELNAYRQLHTNKPNTTILSEADMEVSYVADTKLYIDNKLAELTALALEV